MDRKFRPVLYITLGVIILFAIVLYRPGRTTAPTMPSNMQLPDAGVYASLVERLSKDGYDDSTLRQLYSPGNDVFYERVTKVHLKHRERSDPYEKMYNDRAIRSIREFRAQHQEIFESVDEQYAVDPGVISAILYVESRFGQSAGTHPVVYVFSSMALAGEDWNINALVDEMESELAHLSENERGEKIAYLRRRAESKSSWAYDELKSLLDINRSHNVDILDLRGSWAGAFGMPQFLPSSFRAYAVDGDGDGQIDITQPADAINSVAHYLYRNGWRGRITENKKRKAVWRYNHSWYYVDLIMKLSDAVES
ncbi:MAG: lytic murein transglycosylase [Candidatus Marinimicrobia bacterium]|nr:lytic murein transglycosylase [Candidatus Neomarinimicrobiota bacterium]MCF7829662.1 lytic murein transglycosylase [Candidatus Neomarinimicrobiota bacterium]MCF7879822.1 lytic murein transglycosylase [Candidatus Neomarinimicrobiota bacterium]